MYPGKPQRHSTPPPRISSREMVELEDQIVARLKGHLDYRLEGLKAYIADEIASAKTEILEALEPRPDRAQRLSPRTDGHYPAEYPLRRVEDRNSYMSASRPVRGVESYRCYRRENVEAISPEPREQQHVELPRKPTQRPRMCSIGSHEQPTRAAVGNAVKQDISAQTTMPLINVDPEQPNGAAAAAAVVDAVGAAESSGGYKTPEEANRAIGSPTEENSHLVRRAKSGSTERSTGSNRSRGVVKSILGYFLPMRGKFMAQQMGQARISGARACGQQMRVTNDFVAEDVIELSIKAGERITVNESRPDWTNVINGEGQNGWVPTSHLEPTED
ncbi:hypothetical protein FOL47_009057 [Perkinsus chesapeaki]|uniref:SH3 domain-containing protein n=1 Tax=Perkinsus chesapeaki TaxID=330153 RepID=A0A7J6MUE3_PERCH|nr:hypothetical protein FOL47_009057 [Perkinsus chesapeaki]